MNTKMKKLETYFRNNNLCEAADSIKNKTFAENIYLTQYLNNRFGSRLKSDNWMKILSILNNN